MLAAVVPKGNPPGQPHSDLLGNVYHFCQRWLVHPVSPPALPAPAPTPLAFHRPSLNQLARSEALLPPFVAEDPVARRYLHLLGSLDWEHFPERPTNRPWPGPQPASRAPYVAAYLVKLNEGLRSMGKLRQFLVDHPPLVWLLGFPLVPAACAKHGFDVERSVPLRRQFGRVLRELDNAALRFLLAATVHLIRQALPPELQASFGDVISLDTKNILAWVKENNPKAYVDQRFDKTRQPRGDPDCKLGCKRRHNRGEGNGAETTGAAAPGAAPATPTTNPLSASQKASVGEYYWGYASGVVTTKVPGWGEFVLAELTQTFDHDDATYFHPLMDQTVAHLGRQPRFGALDKAFDAFYVYQWFHDAGGFAAVPLVPKGRAGIRTFSPEGLPLCAAGLPMPRKFTYTDRTKTIVVHQRGRYVCPLLYPQPGATACPSAHHDWPKGGCTVDMPTCAGARIRYQLDRQSAEYKAIYQQRTADERSNAQAVDLGIERPRLRRGSAITNQNTLTYVLINLRALQRVKSHQAELARQAPASAREVTAPPGA